MACCAPNKKPTSNRCDGKNTTEARGDAAIGFMNEWIQQPTDWINTTHHIIIAIHCENREYAIHGHKQVRIQYEWSTRTNTRDRRIAHKNHTHMGAYKCTTVSLTRTQFKLYVHQNRWWIKRKKKCGWCSGCGASRWDGTTAPPIYMLIIQSVGNVYDPTGRAVCV